MRLSEIRLEEGSIERKNNDVVRNIRKLDDPANFVPSNGRLFLVLKSQLKQFETCRNI